MSSEPLSASDVVRFFQADDAEALIAALPLLSDEIRAEAWDALRRPLSSGPNWDNLSPEARRQRGRTRGLVALAIGPADVVRPVGSGVFLVPDADRALASRTLEWREAFTKALLRYWASETEIGLLGPFYWTSWQQLRRLERTGLLRPDNTSPDYVILMIRALLFSGSIVDAVRDDPELVQVPIWSIFQPAAGVQKALLGAERYWDPSNTWRVALVRLALAGVLDGERLASAAATAADDERIGRNHRAWYRKIPELLADPSLLPESTEGGRPPAGNQLYRHN